jgi:hypothetical protein
MTEHHGEGDTELGEQNRTLSEENAALRQLLAAQAQQTEALRSRPTSIEAEGGIEASPMTREELEELQMCRQQLKVANAMAERQYEELLELRRRCAIYAKAIQEGKQAMADMKGLYAKLSELTGAVALPSA